jgi:hypothetical protein
MLERNFGRIFRIRLRKIEQSVDKERSWRSICWIDFAWIPGPEHGEPTQEREWAAGEIRRLRTDVGRLSRKREMLRIETEMDHAEGLDPKLNAQRLPRLAEASPIVGLCRSSIFYHIAGAGFRLR